jgi:hypothetical protein
MLVPGRSSTRPSLPRLTTALEFCAVAMVLSEKTVAPEIAFWPLMVTCPDTDSSPDGPVWPCPGDARATIEDTLKTAIARQIAMDLRLKVLLYIKSPPVK